MVVLLGIFQVPPRHRKCGLEASFDITVSFVLIIETNLLFYNAVGLFHVLGRELHTATDFATTTIDPSLMILRSKPFGDIFIDLGMNVCFLPWPHMLFSPHLSHYSTKSACSRPLASANLLQNEYI